jgi:hypothetical protein
LDAVPVIFGFPELTPPKRPDTHGFTAIGFVPIVGVPVKDGDAKLAFRSSAVCVAVDTGLEASLVLSTLPKPTIALVIPETVPVNVGLARFAFKPNELSISNFE